MRHNLTRNGNIAAVALVGVLAMNARRTGIAVLVAACVLGASTAEAQVARTAVDSKFLIVPGESIGPISLGMTRAAVEAAWPYPYTESTEGEYTLLVYAQGNMTVAFRQAATPQLAILIGTYDPAFSTDKGIGVGSSLQALRDAYPVTCGADPLPPHDVYACQEVHPNGHRTSFGISHPTQGGPNVTGISVVGLTPPGEQPPAEQPQSCPVSAAALIRMSQASCPGGNTYFGSYEKALFRKLAKIAYDGYLVDKAIDDRISTATGETWITENIVGKGNIFKEFVIGKFYGKLVVDKVLGKVVKKLSPYGWMLDAPKYASYLDYAKYAVLTRLANDPPDPNFTALASPPKLRTLRGAKQVGKRDRSEAALYIALLTTVERAAGAQQAGAAGAESAQLRHASGIANQLVSLLGAEQKALKAAARTVKRISRRGHRLPQGMVRRAKRQLGSRSSTRFERKALKELGFTDDEIAAVGQDLPATPLKRFTRPFGKVLGLSAEVKTIGLERAMLANFANRYALGE